MITVIWTCPNCHLKGIREKVENRRTGEDLTAWIEGVATQCGAKHEELNPTCDNESIDLAIPEAENAGDGVGITGKTFMWGWTPNGQDAVYVAPPPNQYQPMAAPRIRPPK